MSLRGIIFIFLLFFILTLFIGTPYIYAKDESTKPVDHKAKLIKDGSQGKIKGLTWVNNEFDVETKSMGQGFRQVVTITGKYQKDEWTFFWDKEDNPQLINVKGATFSVDIEVGTGAQLLHFLAIGPFGEVEKETIGIYVPELAAIKEEIKYNPPRRFYLLPGLGFSLISVKETGIENYSSITSTGKVSMMYFIKPPYIDFGASLFFNIMPITNTPSNVTVRFIGANARGGYRFPFIKAPWSMSFLVGLSYSHMLVSDDSFGYRHLFYPQLYPTVTRGFKNGDLGVAYVKFVPLTASFFGFSTSERELAGGLAYIHVLKNGHSVSSAINYSNTSFNLTSVRKFKSNVISLDFSYGW